MNNESKSLESKEKLSSNVIFGILSFIFSQLSGYFYAGLIIGIIGIIKSIKAEKEKQLSLALSIVGTSLSFINIMMGLISVFIFVCYYFFYFIIMMLTLV